MAQKLCIIHANCQGDTLQFLLKNTPSFAKEYRIQKYTNYLQEDMTPELLQQCQLFLYQHLGNQWGDLATHNLLQLLPAAAHTLEIPNMFFNGYWPLWTNKTFMAYGDIFLEDLCARGLAPREVLHLYMKGKLTSMYDVQALRKVSRSKEETKEKNLPIKTLDFIDTHWQKEQLFYTVNHPAPQLSLYVADKILQHLGHDGVDTAARLALMNHEEEFIQPIHPQISSLYQLSFGQAEQLYPVYGQKMNFQEYANAYIHCRLQTGSDRIDDFVVYLHLLAQREQKHGSS